MCHIIFTLHAYEQTSLKEVEEMVVTDDCCDQCLKLHFLICKHETTRYF